MDFDEGLTELHFDTRLDIVCVTVKISVRVPVVVTEREVVAVSVCERVFIEVKEEDGLML